MENQKTEISSEERMLLFVLAAIQFTTMLDFLIILPLGPQYMRVFSINAAEFGVIVSAYAISAGISGVAAGLFLDRFDRKPAMLLLFAGFTLGTFFCAIAPNYPLLVAARVFAGAFGGVAGSLILAIIGDVVPEKRRGAAMGMVMSSFSVASICGVPLGLWLASHFSWHIPFYVLTVLSLVVLLGSAFYIPSLKEHLKHERSSHPMKQLWAVMTEPNHRNAFVFMAALTGAGFSIFPYIATYMVANVGLTERQLPLIYLVGGLCTLFTMNLIGRWADRSGKLRVFRFMSLLAIMPILALTNLPHVPIFFAILTSTIFMICMSGRTVPAMALMTASVEARYRGSFMSINSSVQQFASGLFAYLSGVILGKSETGSMTHFGWVGVGSITCVLLCIYLSRFLKQPANPTSIQAPVYEAA